MINTQFVLWKEVKEKSFFMMGALIKDDAIQWSVNMNVLDG